MSDHDSMCPQHGQTRRTIIAFDIPCRCGEYARIRADERERGDKAVGGFLLEAISQRDAARAEVERLGEIVREQDEHAAWMRQCWKAVAEERDEARADAIVATRERDARVRADERERRGNNCRGMWEEWLVDLRKRIKELPITRTQALSHGWDSVGLNEVLALLDEEGGGDE